MATGVGLM